jgi:hypothetical protein
MKFDGSVKSPSAALPFTFVVAAFLCICFTPQFLRALSRLWRESFLRNHGSGDFLRDLQIQGLRKKPPLQSRSPERHSALFNPAGAKKGFSASP